jgi:hypothetical protein
MTFVAPLLLWLLPLSLLPILFHLFFRVRRQPRVFSSLMFFLAADPRLSARRRIREWLLLALRCLMLLALLLALARPVRRGQRGGAVTLVAIVDNSASMQAGGPDGANRLTRATAAAAALCEDAAVAVAGIGTTVEDPRASMPSGVTADRALVRTALAAIRPTHAAGDPLRAIQSAIASVGGALRTSGEVHVLTDLQAGEWQGELAAIELPPAVSLFVHDVGDDRDLLGTVAIADIQAPRRPPLAGRPWQTRVKVRNLGAAEAEVVLHAQCEGTGEHYREPVKVPAQGEREVRLVFKKMTEGEMQVRAWLEGRSASAAAEAWLLVPPSDGVDVVLVDDLVMHGLLGPALAPTDDGLLTGIRLSSVAVLDLAGRVKQKRPAMIAATASQLAQPALAELLQACVLAGVNLLVAPDRGWPASRTALPDWCGVEWGELYRDEAGGAWRILQGDADVWSELRGPDGEPLWRDVVVHRAVKLQVGSEALSLAGLGPDDVLLTQRRLGQGRVTVSGVAWDPLWSNLPHKAAFLALVQGIALSGQSGEPVNQGIAGARLKGWVPPKPEDAAAVVEIAAQAGEQGRWQLPTAELRVPVRAGVYQIKQGGLMRRFTVTGDAREADGQRVRGSVVPRLAAVPHRIIREKNATSRVQAVQALRRGKSLFAPLLIMAIAALLAEAWLGLGAKRSPVAPGRP